MDIKIGIKDLAIFACQSGDLTNEFFSNRDLENGTKAHRYLQSKYQEGSQKEVYIKTAITYYQQKLILHGFIDGVINDRGNIIIEEIKSTLKDLDEVSLLDRPEYFAQAKIYGYLYALEHSMDPITLRLTYISAVDYSTRSFDSVLSLDELEEFVFDCLDKYMVWYNLQQDALNKKEETISSVKFPFSNMRPGQRDMMRACYQTMKTEDILYCIAPTGIGKTMGTMFSSLKTLEKNDKLFYLTAKGSGKNAPINAIRILEEKGLKIKTINLIAKKKICNSKFKNCKPEECPYAIGFFDRIKDALLEIFRHHDIYDEEIISEVANKHRICAFEFSLELSYYCDIVIADYNYVFDPRAQLIRYFEDDTYHPKVLVDEAHNLISRSKDMYSASINEEDIRILRRTLNEYKPSIRNDCNKAIERIASYKEYLANQTIYVDTSNDLDLVVVLKHILVKCDEIFANNKKIPHKDDALDAYLKILDYTQIADYYGPTHRLIATLENDMCTIEEFCLDASSFILDTIKTSVHGIVFFSATLKPFEYYADLLTQGEGKFLELASPFDPNNLDIIINNRVSTKFKQREQSIDYILEAIEALTLAKSGNYIVFFPSYQYMNMVVNALGDVDFEVLVQKSDFNESERNQMIDAFKNTDHCKVGFFVLGGVFAEGIDYIGDWLNGVIIVGVGLPMICDRNNLLKDYFEQLYQNGFDYAYTYPGFTKVVQAAGRVIRSEEDRGVVILIDERFSHYHYQELMPTHWTNKKMISDSYYLKKELKKFLKE
ncbi:MAG: ATP-dependent DNA helicase [Anaeroplasmataceae bacterium]|nr:ATP-dependent DNA helicase [Anaeroplasmataceae bacterium]